MQRRFFLQSLLATAVLDPERLLWVPRKRIFIPPAPRIEVIDMIEMEWSTREIIMDMEAAMEPYTLPPEFLRSWADFIDKQAADFAYRSLEQK